MAPDAWNEAGGVGRSLLLLRRLFALRGFSAGRILHFFRSVRVGVAGRFLLRFLVSHVLAPF